MLRFFIHLTYDLFDIQQESYGVWNEVVGGVDEVDTNETVFRSRVAVIYLLVDQLGFVALALFTWCLDMLKSAYGML